MDAKTRDLALLAALSLVGTIFAWAGDRDIVGSAFFALGLVAIVGAAYGQQRWHGQTDPQARRYLAPVRHVVRRWFWRALQRGEIVGRIMKAAAAPVGTPWMWTLAFGHHEATHGYEPTREAAMATFAKSWRRQD
jgi:hypothetical protein